MSDKNDSTSGLVAFLNQIWGRIAGIVGVASAILGYIKLAEGNLGLFTLILLIVGVACLYLSCFYYYFLWQPKRKDSSESDNSSSLLVLPDSNQPGDSQETKPRRKIVRRSALVGFVLITILLLSGIGFYQYQAQLPAKDFKILVANFESSDSTDFDVTGEIFSNLQTEMKEYDDDVKVEKLGKPLGSIQEAKQAGKKQKAAIVIWGDYSVMKKIVPIRVNFEILHESTDYFRLNKLVQGKTQTVQISELESFELQTNLSEQMTYLSLFTLGMYRYLDADWQQAVEGFAKALAVAQDTDKSITFLRREVISFYLGNSAYYLELYDNSLKLFDRVVNNNPNDDAAWNNRGVTLNELGEYERAIASFDKVVEINPDDDAAWNNRGNALDKLDEHEQALSNYDKALKINPNLEEAWYNRGSALANLDRYEEAVTSYDEAIAIDSDNDAAWYNRGNALIKLGEYKEAVTSYDKAIFINPNDASAIKNRHLTLKRFGELMK